MNARRIRRNLVLGVLLAVLVAVLIVPVLGEAGVGEADRQICSLLSGADRPSWCGISLP